MLLVALAPLVLAVGTAAQPLDADADARAAFASAREAFARGDYQAAVEGFRRAHAISGEFELLYNIGQAEIRLDNVAAAIEAWEGFLRFAPMEHPERPNVEERLVSLRGERREASDGTARSSSGPRHPAPNGPLLISGAIGLLVGFTGLAASAVIGVVALASDGALSDRCGASGVCTADDVAAVDDLALAADVTFGVSAGVLALSVALMALAFSFSEGPEAPAAVGAVLTPTGAGVTWRSVF